MANLEKIFVSQCILGEAVRYDGKHSLIEHPLLKEWMSQGRLVSLCPEVAGGLPVPRDPAEIKGADGTAVLTLQSSVITREGDNVSQAFIDGANAAAELCKKHQIQVALLKSKSPSCGNEKTYDGSFSRTLIEGQGVTSARLKQLGIQVFNEHQLIELQACINALEVE